MSTVSGMTVAPGSGFNLGKGWTHSYGGMVYSPSAGVMRVVEDDGTINDFTLSGSDWVPPPGVHDTLTQVGSEWRLTRRNATYRHFDSGGRLVNIGDTAGNVVTVHYATIAGHERIKKVTDAAGRDLTFSYDPDTGRLASLTAPLTASTTRTWNLTYDANGWLTDIVAPKVVHTQIAYDTAGRIRTVSDPKQNVSSITYDNGFGVLVTDPAPFDQQVQNFDYKVKDLTLERTYIDRMSNSWVHQFQKTSENLLSVTDPLGNVRSWTYDADRNRLTATNPLNKTTTYTYDAAGRRTVETYPDDEGENPANVRFFTYDKVGNVIQRTDQNGDHTFYTYDDLHRLTGRSYIVASGMWPLNRAATVREWSSLEPSGPLSCTVTAP